ncbi:MAG: DUF4168 domain-containing protein [Balneolaceae bacterium]
MKVLKSLSVILIGILFGASVAFGQGMGQGQQQMPDLPTSEDVSDEELSQFVKTIADIEPVQMEAQANIEEAVAEEELDFERFQQLMMAMQNPQMADQVEISDEEQEKIESIQPKLTEIQMGAEEEIIAMIEDNGLDVERYQAIMMGAQQDQELMTRLQTELEGTGTDG